jgi:hypothetical protein
MEGAFMTSRLLLTGVLTGAAVRRKRKADGVLFAVAKIKDTDRSERRIWTVFATDIAVIEALEELRIGEPVAVAGPFSISVSGTKNEPKIEYKLTAESLLDVKRRKKPKGQIAKEQRVESDEFERAPFNDPLPFEMTDAEICVNTLAARASD